MNDLYFSNRLQALSDLADSEQKITIGKQQFWVKLHDDAKVNTNSLTVTLTLTQGGN